MISPESRHDLSLDPAKSVAARKIFETMRSGSEQALQTALVEHGRRSKLMFDDFAKQWNINDPKGPVGILFRQAEKMQSTLERVEQQNAAQARVDAIRNRTPLKGATLEGWIGSILAPFASVRGESFQHCATTQGAINHSFAGDSLHCTDGSGDGRHPLRVGIEAKHEQKPIESLRRYLARVRENRDAAAALAITTRFSEPLAIYDKCHVIVSVPDFGKPGADHAFYEKLIINGLIIAQMLAQVATQTPTVESVDRRAARPRDRLDREPNSLSAG